MKTAIRAAFRLPGAEGMTRLEKQGQWLEREHPDAAASFREGLKEMFIVNRLGLSPALCRCLSSMDTIGSLHTEVGMRTRRICPGMTEGWHALGGGRVSDHREEFSQNLGLPPSVDSESGSG